MLFAVEFACIFIGLQYTSASRMVVFIYLSPFVVALGMPFIVAAERLDRWQLLGLAAAFAGVVWAFAGGFTGPTVGPRQWFGDALGLTAGRALGPDDPGAARQPAGHRPAREDPALPAAGVRAGAGGGSAAVGEAWPAQLSGASLWPLAFQTVVVSFASYLVWFWLLRHYPATRLSAFTLLTPMFGLLAGVLLLGEPVTWRLLLALAAVSLGIALVNRLGRRT